MPDKKDYNLEDRTLKFASDVINLCRALKQDAVNSRIISQLVGSSGSVGANYREAGESVSKKDFLHRMKITRKECKESTYWLQLLLEANPLLKKKVNLLIDESKELRNIFTAIINKSA